MAEALAYPTAVGDPLTIAHGVLYREARYLDRQQWDEWLSLYREDAEFWVPSWDSEHRLVENPRREVSLMYYADRTGLEDRVFRLRTGRSSASTPLPRTLHSVTNIEAEPLADGELSVLSNWRCTSYKDHKSHEFYGHYEHTLAPGNEDEWRVVRKKTVVKNELIPIPMDFYNI